MLPFQFSCQKHGSRFPMIYLAVAIMLLFPSQPASSCSQQESNSLLQFLAGLSEDGNLTMSWKNGTKFFELPVYKDQSLQYRFPSAFPKELNLGKNNFTGTIPEEIGQLKGLISLNLSSNRLYGEIPQSISNLTNLQVLNLSSNHLTGAIPAGLNNLQYLSEFDVSFNDLEGPVPTTGQFSTFTASSFDGNPKLCGPMLIECNSAEEGPMSIVYENQGGSKVIFAISFGLFFGVGVLYDQVVLSRYFG